MTTAFASMLTGHVQEWTLTGYGSLDLVTDPTDKGVDTGFSLAFEGNRLIKGKWGGYGELARNLDLQAIQLRLEREALSLGDLPTEGAQRRSEVVAKKVCQAEVVPHVGTQGGQGVVARVG